MTITKSISIRIQRNVTGKPKVTESITFPDDTDLIDILPQLNEKINRLRKLYEINLPENIKAPIKSETSTQIPKEQPKTFKYTCDCGNGFNEAVNKNIPNKCPTCALFT